MLGLGFWKQILNHPGRLRVLTDQINNEETVLIRSWSSAWYRNPDPLIVSRLSLFVHNLKPNKFVQLKKIFWNYTSRTSLQENEILKYFAENNDIIEAIIKYFNYSGSDP